MRATPAPSLEPLITEGESRGCTGEFQGPARVHQASPHTGHLKTQRILVTKLSQILTLPLTHVHSHIQHLILHKSPFKTATSKIQLSVNSMVSGLWSVLITEWIS
jgi:hypothetical protein